MRHLLNFALLLVAMLLTVVLAPLGVGFTLYRCIVQMEPKKAVGYLSSMALSVAIAIDEMGNVVCRDLFNRTLIKSDGYQFGQQETISHVLGVNKGTNTLTDAGRALANLLNYIDPGHVEKAV